MASTPSSGDELSPPVARRNAVVVLAGEGTTLREISRIDLPTLEVESFVGGTSIARGRAEVDVAAVAVDVGRAAGRAEPTALGRWRLEGALQEGGPRPTGIERRFDEEPHAFEGRLTGEDFFGRGHVDFAASSRNYDPLTGLLLDGDTALAPTGTHEATRWKVGYDLVRRPLDESNGFLDVGLSFEHKQSEGPLPHFGVLTPLASELGSRLEEPGSAAVAVLSRRDAKEAGSPWLVHDAPVRLLTDALELGASIGPGEAGGEGDPGWWSRLGIGYRRLAGRPCCQPRRAVPHGGGRNREGPFATAALRGERWNLRYGFQFLAAETLDGKLLPTTMTHRIDAGLALAEPLRIRFGVGRDETSGPLRDFGATRSNVTLQWRFAPRWTFREEIRFLVSSAPGPRIPDRSYAVETRIGRDLRLLEPFARNGRAFVRTSLETGAPQHRRVDLAFDERVWSFGAGLSLTF